MNETRLLAPEDISAGPIEQTRASDSARLFLRSLIYTGVLGPGDLLPPERQLAAQLGISRITLREALKSLEGAGYLVTKVGAKGGTRVADIPSLKRCFDAWLKTQTDQLESLFEWNRIVEMASASMAAERRTGDDLRQLMSTRIPENPTRSLALRQHNAFHETLARATHNLPVVKAVLEIRRQIFVPIDYLMDGSHIREFREDHDRILEAVRDQDPARAAAEMDQHLISPRTWDNLLGV